MSSNAKVDLAKLLAQPNPETYLYACGPAGFLNVVQSVAASASWHVNNVHQEHFAASAADASVQGSTSSSAVVDQTAATFDETRS